MKLLGLWICLLTIGFRAEAQAPIKIALDPTNGTTLSFRVAIQSPQISQVLICPATTSAISCPAGTNGIQILKPSTTAGAVNFFTMPSALSFQTGIRINILAYNGANTVGSRRIGFEVNNNPTTPTSSLISTNDGGKIIQIQEIKIKVPQNWIIHQQGSAGGILFAGFKSGNEYFRIYARQGSVTTQELIDAQRVQVTTPEAAQTYGGLSWGVLSYRTRSQNPISATAFSAVKNGFAYYGYSPSLNATSAASTVQTFLQGIQE